MASGLASPSPTLNPALERVRCSFSGTARAFEPGKPLGLCDCCVPAKPLLLEYDPEVQAREWTRLRSSAGAPRGIRRYAFALPVEAAPSHFEGVGGTGVVEHALLSEELGVRVLLKNEGGNPSGSFKDRGLSVAVAFGLALGARSFCLPTQGNAGVAAAMFCSRLGLPACKVWMPTSHERSVYALQARHFGAELEFVGNDIAEAGRAMRQAHASQLGSGELVDLSTFFEPGRLEGKKTLGFEIFETLHGALPDAIVYPTGGGTGLVGIWKAFEELRVSGALEPQLLPPRLVAVQAERCAPVVRAFEAGEAEVSPVTSGGTQADGLNVPAAIMGHAILRAIRDSQGTAIAVTEAAMQQDFERLATLGVATGLEAAATLSGLRTAVERGFFKPGSRVLLLLTSGPFAALYAAGAASSR